MTARQLNLFLVKKNKFIKETVREVMGFALNGIDLLKSDKKCLESSKCKYLINKFLEFIIIPYGMSK